MRISDWSSDVCSSDLGVDDLQRQRQQGLQADDARLGDGEGQALRLDVVRAVIAGDGVDGAVGDARQDGLAVVLAAQRRRDLGEGAVVADRDLVQRERSEEHTSELQSLMRISYAVFCLKKKTHIEHTTKYESQ